MYNLPIDSSISDNKILHDGNHDGRGNPHKQYVNVWDMYKTPQYQLSLPSSHVKICEINYERDNNTVLGYNIELFNEYETDKIGMINLSLGVNGIMNFSLNNNGYCTCKAVLEDIGIVGGKTQSKVTLYLNIFRNFRAIYYRLVNAKNSQPISFANYPDDYAYKCIKLINSKEFTDIPLDNTEAKNIPVVGNTSITNIADGTLSGAVGTLLKEEVVNNGITFNFFKVGRICVVVISGSPSTILEKGGWRAILPFNLIPNAYRTEMAYGDVGLTVANGYRYDIGYTNGNGISVFPRIESIPTNDLINMTITYIV